MANRPSWSLGHDISQKVVAPRRDGGATTSILELFKIGIGPSSSHTVGPMLTANAFAAQLASTGHLLETTGVTVDLFRSLGYTGRGHQTDKAVTLGLQEADPRSVEVDGINSQISSIQKRRNFVLPTLQTFHLTASQTCGFAEKKL